MTGKMEDKSDPSVACIPEPFIFHAPSRRAVPVLFSVPHAGRFYPEPVMARRAVSMSAVSLLEDRHVDALITNLIEQGYSAFIARVARAVIDLNRDPRDIDRRSISGIPHGQALIETAKSRGGLGLFPYTLPRVGALWRGRLDWAEAKSRIDAIHAPYHVGIEREMKRIREVEAQVLLLDIHSMPPLERERFVPGLRPDIVIGDRFGMSAAPRFSEIARSVFSRHGLVVAINHPYPGNYILERHGRPVAGRHAIQIEISRDLYLDERLDLPGRGVGVMQGVLSDLASAMIEELRGSDLPVAAE